MKQIANLSAVIFTLIMVGITAKAEYLTVNCFSNRGTDHELTLIIANNDVKQVRISLSTGNHPYPMMITRLENQNIEGKTLYSLHGAAGLMEVENTIFAAQYGQVRMLGDVFSCN
jgi:hypothetical protein